MQNLPNGRNNYADTNYRCYEPNKLSPRYKPVTTNLAMIGLADLHALLE